MYTQIELFVMKLYKKLKLSNPNLQSIEEIGNFFGVDIEYDFSISACLEGLLIIKDGTSAEKWESFGHELCHHLRHIGNQRNMHPLFREMQEYQADYFAYHFCVPTFMIENMKLPNCLNSARSLISERFHVSPKFAERRLEMWMNSKFSKEVIHMKEETVQVPILKNFRIAGDNLIAAVDGYIDTPISVIEKANKEENQDG